MKDILRLGRYLRPYTGRILMAVAASFIATVFLGGFWYLASSSIRDTLSPPAAGTAGAGANGTTAEAVRGRGPFSAAGGQGSAAAGVGSIGEVKGWLAGVRTRLADALGITAFNAWIKKSPFTRLPPVIVLLFLLKGLFNY